MTQNIRRNRSRFPDHARNEHGYTPDEYGHVPDASNGPGHTRRNLVAYLLADPRVSDQERDHWQRALWLADRLDEEATP